MSPATRVRLLGAAVLIAAVAGCAPVTQRPGVDEAARAAEQQKQLDLVAREYADRLRRLHRVAFRELQHGAEICAEHGKVTYAVGILAFGEKDVATNMRMAARRVLDLTAETQAFSVAPASPAYAAGVRTGDLLVSLDGNDKVAHDSRLARRWLKGGDAETAGKALAIVVERAGVRHAFSVTPVQVCDYGFAVTAEADVNAAADGDKITINAGMMDFVRSDDELATVVGHEIAHNVMQHIRKKQGNAILGTVLDVLVAGLTGVNDNGAFANMAAGAYSQEFEAEADYVGLYIMARAGYDIATAPRFWRRMAVQFPRSIKKSHQASHPSTPERFVALSRTIDEIQAKRAAHQPLLPNLADAGGASPGAASPTSGSRRELN